AGLLCRSGKREISREFSELEVSWAAISTNVPRGTLSQAPRGGKLFHVEHCWRSPRFPTLPAVWLINWCHCSEKRGLLPPVYFAGSEMAKMRCSDWGIGVEVQDPEGRIWRAEESWASPISRARRPEGFAKRAAIGSAASNRSTARRRTTSAVEGGKSSARPRTATAVG